MTVSGCVYDPPMVGIPFIAVLWTEGRIVSAGAASSEDEAYDLLVRLLTEHAQQSEPDSQPAVEFPAARARGRPARGPEILRR